MGTMRLFALLLVACGAAEPRMFTVEPVTCCACPPDAAPPDAPPIGAIDLAQPWTRTVITPGAASGPFRGADGVAEDAEHCWWSPWEQGGAVTRACPIGQDWTTELAATGIAAPEDVKPADFDGDGLIDGAIAASSQSAAAVHIVFRGTPNQTITVSPASVGLGPVMQLAVADVDADGDTDIVFGTQKTSTAAGTIAWLENPGPSMARLGIHWNRHAISAAGWPMSIVPVPGGIVVSDRAKIGTNDWSLYGARLLLRQNDNSWTSQTIGYPAGSCSPYTSATCAKTPGDEMMLSVVPTDDFGSIMVVDGQSNGAQVDSRIMLHWPGSSLHTLVPPVAAVGHYQHAVAYDVDEDGDLDLVVSTWIADSLAGADRTKSGVYWLRLNSDGTYSRGEVSGPGAGVKFDNIARLGRCVVTSEQVDQLGTVAYCPPGVSLP